MPAPRPLGLVVNPLSGRDVRRLLGRAGNDTPDAKRNQLERAAIGAAMAGVERILWTPDVFRIAERALEYLPIDAVRERLELGRPETRPSDTLRTVAAMRAAGCGALLVLGGDGTNRLVATAWPDAPIVPLSTGTNNVFPLLVEPTLAGAAAGLVASGRIALGEVATRAKVVRVRSADGATRFALVDAGLLADDHVGSLLALDPAKLRTLVLARAEPASVGLSPLGGMTLPCGPDDDFGVEVRIGPGGRALLAPISPGIYRTALVGSTRRLALGETVEVKGPGVLALDGDREVALAPGERAELAVVREGPQVIDVARALKLAAARGLYWDRPHVHEPSDGGHGPGCC
jgi:ATP-NAD kinase N-terminal domain